MGIGGISIWQLVIILAIVILLFGTKKMRNIGGDLGSAIKNFKSSMADGEQGVDSSADADKPAAADKLKQQASSADTKADATVASGTSGDDKAANSSKPS